MISGLVLPWLLASLPIAWLLWSRNGLPGPSFHFPRDPIPGSISLIPDGKCLLIGAAMGCWAGSLVLVDPIQARPSTLFLIDNSASMGDPTLNPDAKITTRLKLGTDLFQDLAGATGAFEGVETGRVGLVRFSTMPRVIQPLTEDRLAVSAAIAALEPEKTPLDAETNLVDGLIEALVRINAVPSPRRTIILWTDGEANVRDNASGWTLSQVAMAIRALGVKLIIADASPGEPEPQDQDFARREQARKLLARLVVDADGVLLKDLDPSELAPHFPKKVNHLDRSTPRLFLAIAGLVCGFGGLLLFWKNGLYQSVLSQSLSGRKSALSRSIVWSRGARGAFRRFGLLAASSWVCAFVASFILYLDWSRSRESLSILFDVRPAMLSGQPSRMEQARRFLDRVFDNGPVRTGLSQPVQAWVMAGKPIRVFASTWDVDAIRDEWDRLETWAENGFLFSPLGETENGLPGRTVWVSDGFGPTPKELGSAREIAVVTPGGFQSGRLERSGEIWEFPENLKRLQEVAGWGKLFTSNDNPESFQDWMTGGRFFFSHVDRIFLGFALGLMVLTMLPGVARVTKVSPKQMKFGRASVGPGTTLILLCLGGMAWAGDVPDKALTALERARQSLVKIKDVPVVDRLSLLEQAGKHLDMAEQLGAKDDLHLKLLRFLVLAHKRDLTQKASLPPEGGPDQEKRPAGSRGDGQKENPQKANKTVPFEGALPKGDAPSMGNDRIPGGLISPGDPVAREPGLYDQLLMAQRKIAQESTTRRLSRIIPRDWNKGETPR